jgi:hypothetical protein
MAKEIRWYGRIEKLRKKKKERKKDHQGHTDDLFLTHSVLLERSQQDVFNYILEDH